MARIMVHIETDHTDDNEAARSVMNSLQRAGYDVISHQVAGNGINEHRVRNTMHEFIHYIDPILIEAAEPEVDRRNRANQH